MKIKKAGAMLQLLCTSVTFLGDRSTGVRPVTKWITSNTIPTKNRSQAICVAIAATPESPKTPAINPRTKNTNA